MNSPVTITELILSTSSNLHSLMYYYWSRLNYRAEINMGNKIIIFHWKDTLQCTDDII